MTGPELRALREDAEVTLVAMAAEVHRDQSTVWRWEMAAQPRPKWIRLYMDALDRLQARKAGTA